MNLLIQQWFWVVSKATNMQRTSLGVQRKFSQIHVAASLDGQTLRIRDFPIWRDSDEAIRNLRRMHIDFNLSNFKMNSIQNVRICLQDNRNRKASIKVCSQRRRASDSPISTIRPCSVYLFRISQNHTILCLLKCPTVQSLLPFCNYCPLQHVLFTTDSHLPVDQQPF